MEHSLLHGLQICGIVFALGGLLFRFLVARPVLSNHPESASALDVVIARWITRAAVAAAIAAAADIFVQVAEIDGRTILSGANLGSLGEYLGSTSVGRIALIKTLLLVTAALHSCRRKGQQLTLLLLGAAVVATTLVSHSAALPVGRMSAIASQVAHVAAAAFWLGMLSFLTLTVIRAETPRDPITALAHRFSPFALASFFIIVASGVFAACRFIASPSAILLSAYGLTLLLKVFLLVLAAAAGFINWRIVRPAGCPRERFARLLEFELSTGVVLLLVAGILGAISPPSEPGVAQLTDTQIAALLAPRLPSTKFPDPALFVGAAERTEEDLRYAEFTHQWSGVFVTLLGLCWLGQSLRGAKDKVFARIWPALLVVFGIFITVVADPEIWILRTYSWSEVLANPQMLEHQIGAVLVFALAALGYRDRKREPHLRPLGPGFPLVMICGSMMLLGHAHSNLGVSEELSSIINFEHAIIGGLGLLAGLARWFQLRQLPGDRIFARLWPVSLIVLGVFMSFFYREQTADPVCAPDPAYSMISR